MNYFRTTESRLRTGAIVTSAFALLASSPAAILQYGDQDLCNTGTYSSSPTAGTTMQGLAVNAVTYGPAFGHSYPFSPTAGDYPGTDQIYVGAIQTGNHDGYSGSTPRINGPQVVTMNYASLVPAGQAVTSLTLGIAADDFQFTAFGQPFTASINGVVNPTLTSALNGLNQTGPYTQFLTLGVAPGLLTSTNVLTLSINEGGDGGDGWAIDFLTVGVTTQAVPEPSAFAALGLGALTLLRRRSRRV